MRKCENCGNVHDGSYASGRFCSLKCSRAFATKAKRKEISEKVSKTLSGPIGSRGGILLKEFVCQNCSKTYEVRKKKSKFCSKRCSGQGKIWTDESRAKLSKAQIDRILRGEHTKSLKSIKCVYVFQGEKVRCDSKVEYACLNYFEENFEVESISRVPFSLQFEYEGTRNYVPDFIIVANGKTFVVECKAQIGVNAQVSRKWKYYYATIEAKKHTLIEYCNANGYESFFFDKSMHAKFYKCFRDVSPHTDNV